MKTFARISSLVAVTAALASGCAASHKVNVAPVRVEPIRMVVDVNVHVDDEGPSTPDE